VDNFSIQIKIDEEKQKSYNCNTMVTIQTKIKPRTRKNLSRYAGEWVAFVKANVVAHDKSLSKTMAQIEKQGLQDKASVFLVPRKNEGPYVL
jgi:hypothetical protein